MSVRLPMSGSSGKVKVAQVSGLTVTVGFSTPGTMLCEWVNPDDVNLMGVIVRYSDEDYPKSEMDGYLAYDSNLGEIAKTCTITGLIDGTTYYVSAFAYTILGTTRIVNSKLTTENMQSAIPLQVQGQMIFTSSGIFVPPIGVTMVDVFLVGGGVGGGAGTGSGYSSTGGAGGGAGYARTYKNIPVTQGENIAITVGAGGGGATEQSSGGAGGAGGTSSFKTYTATSGSNRNGGSGGGYPGTQSSPNGGAGGSNGGASLGSSPASGQGSTTRAFAETNGTLYSGGGGAGGWNGNGGSSGGAGGGGNGGASGGAGGGNTGGGGGGGSTTSGSWYNGGSGGSGIVIVRWGY